MSNLKLVTGRQMAEIDRRTIDAGVASGAESVTPTRVLRRQVSRRLLPVPGARI